MKVVYSSKFKKDLKRYQNQPHKIRALGEVIKHLKKHGRVPMEYRPQRLHGIFKGSMECHIEDDFPLIWVDEATNTVKLLRLGTHHELLGI